MLVINLLVIIFSAGIFLFIGSIDFEYEGNIMFHINSISIQFTIPLFLDFFQNKTIDDKSKDGALWSILCSILPYMLRIKKKIFISIHFDSFLFILETACFNTSF